MECNFKWIDMDMELKTDIYQTPIWVNVNSVMVPFVVKPLIFNEYC